VLGSVRQTEHSSIQDSLDDCKASYSRFIMQMPKMLELYNQRLHHTISLIFHPKQALVSRS
jgi:hypothetical protein